MADSRQIVCQHWTKEQKPIAVAVDYIAQPTWCIRTIRERPDVTSVPVTHEFVKQR